VGLDITVMIADWSWLEQAPPRERLKRLRYAWYADETGLWDHDAPRVEGGWVWPQGPDSAFFALYEFLQTCGSFKAHFWAGQRWEAFRDHVDPLMRTELDAFLRGLIWNGLDGEAEHTDKGFFSDDPDTFYGVLLARSPDSVRQLTEIWERIQPHLGDLRRPFTQHAAVPGGWIGDFDSFTRLLGEWSRVLAEASRRGWGIAGLSE
jgi:hypothetical protein